MIEILLVEDSPADVRLTVEALKEAKIRNQIHVSTQLPSKVNLTAAYSLVVICLSLQI